MIGTPRLILRDFRLSDLDAYCQLRAHEDFQQFYPPHEVTNLRSSELLREFMRWAAENPRLRFQLAIEEPGRGLIGSCGLRISELERGQASFGCELGRESWGHGYAIEAALALVGFAFSELGVDRVEAETVSENRSALSLARRLGMRVVEAKQMSREFRGRTWDTVTLAILSSEWTERKPQGTRRAEEGNRGLLFSSRPRNTASDFENEDPDARGKKER